MILWFLLALNSVNDSCKKCIASSSLYQNKVTFYSVFNSNLKWLCICLFPLYRGSTAVDSYICKRCIKHRRSLESVAFGISSGQGWSIREACGTLVDF